MRKAECGSAHPPRLRNGVTWTRATDHAVLSGVSVQREGAFKLPRLLGSTHSGAWYCLSQQDFSVSSVKARPHSGQRSGTACRSYLHCGHIRKLHARRHSSPCRSIRRLINSPIGPIAPSAMSPNGRSLAGRTNIVKLNIAMLNNTITASVRRNTRSSQCVAKRQSLLIAGASRVRIGECPRLPKIWRYCCAQRPLRDG